MQSVLTAICRLDGVSNASVFGLLGFWLSGFRLDKLTRVA